MAGTITRLEVQKRNKERVSVYLDDEFAFGLSLLLAAALRKGQRLSDAEIAALREQDGVEKAYERALNYLSYRARSEREIRTYLRRKDVDEDVAEEIVARLRRVGLVDDAAFASLWVRNRQATSPRGERALRQELWQKGIARDVVDEALTDLDETGQALEAGRSRAQRLAGLEAAEFRKKLTDFLLRRGFSYGVARGVVAQVWAETTGERLAMEDEGE
ncbi:MAG: RecX family transcriptional regulator [Anaerolineae bacterium]|jgi:regulatory protein|nr:RecX family transcriptional regulator [Anaerolineae bacterium]